jgi:Domain of unknown function (DUF4062)
MNQPAVFISCVSPEFGQTRSRVATILTRLGYTPVIQEIFGTEPGDLRQVLRDKINACEGLIQIVGQGYGAEPPTVDAGYGRVSYTQFEFLYARGQKKKTWLIFAGDACTRDTPLERLDLPNDPTHPDPVGYQAERRALQLSYNDKRRNDGHLYYEATGDTDLELKVERLRDELAELRQAFEAWQKEVLGRLTITTEKIQRLELKDVESLTVRSPEPLPVFEPQYANLAAVGTNVLLSSFTLATVSPLLATNFESLRGARVQIRKTPSLGEVLRLCSVLELFCLYDHVHLWYPQYGEESPTFPPALPPIEELKQLPAAQLLPALGKAFLRKVGQTLSIVAQGGYQALVEGSPLFTLAQREGVLHVIT